MKQEETDKRCIELLKKAMGKEYDNVSEIAIRKTLELSPILQNQLEELSHNDICKWFDDVVKITAKAERDKTAKEIEKLIMKMDMDIACDKARFFESKYIAHYERLLRILKQKYGCKDK